MHYTPTLMSIPCVLTNMYVLVTLLRKTIESFTLHIYLTEIFISVLIYYGLKTGHTSISNVNNQYTFDINPGLHKRAKVHRLI